MSIRTTVTLEDDVLERVKLESRSRRTSFRQTLNDLLRLALLQQEKQPRPKKFVITPYPMGLYPGLNYDDVEGLIEYGEGENHR